MTLLIFEPSKPWRSGTKKPLKFILGISALVGTIALGSTLAASINLNSGAPVEFGQGVAQTVACDDNVIVTPQSTFMNNEVDADFLLTSLSVTDVSNECTGKIFVIKAYKNGQDTALELYEAFGTSYSEIKVKNFNGSFNFVGGGLFAGDIQDIATGFSVTIGAGTLPGFALVSGQELDRITIESRDQTEPEGEVVYTVGQTGPGGGTIYYASISEFDCGPTLDLGCKYLEVAPSGWNTDADDPLKVWANEIYDLDVASITNDSIAYNNPLGIGLGHKNSNAIVDQGNNTLSAAGLARSYPGGSKDDWYLPTTAELNLLCQWARNVTQDVTTPCTGGTLNSGTGINGGFRDYYYWSSSERPASLENVRPDAWLQFFSDGVQGESHKDGTYAVRPIRAF